MLRQRSGCLKVASRKQRPCRLAVRVRSGGIGQWHIFAGVCRAPVGVDVFSCGFVQVISQGARSLERRGCGGQDDSLTVARIPELYCTRQVVYSTYNILSLRKVIHWQHMSTSVTEVLE